MYLEGVGWYVMIFGTLSAPWLGTIPVRCPVFYSCDCPIVLLFYCPIVLLSYYPFVLLSYCPIVLFYCPVVLLSYYPIFLLSYSLKPSHICTLSSTASFQHLPELIPSP
jgi:hypothetical protein